MAIEQVETEDVPDTGAFRWQERERKRPAPAKAVRPVRRGVKALLARVGIGRAPRLPPRHPARIDSRFVLEEHHSHYGRPWCLGRDHFEFLLSRGCRPQHKVLDLGCGALRTGIWLIPYLNAGCYFGIDAHRPSLAAGAEYEIPLHGLADKGPRLLHTADFRCDHFGVTFDWVIAFSLFNRLDLLAARQALQRVCGSLADRGRILIGGAKPFRPEPLLKLLPLHVDGRFAQPCRFLRSTNHWVEIVKGAE